MKNELVRDYITCPCGEQKHETILQYKKLSCLQAKNFRPPLKDKGLYTQMARILDPFPKIIHNLFFIFLFI